MNSDCTRTKLSAALGACAAEINLLRKRRIGPYFPDFSANRTTMHLKIVKIWPRFSTFSLRSFLPRRLLVRKGCPGEDRRDRNLKFSMPKVRSLLLLAIPALLHVCSPLLAGPSRLLLREFDRAISRWVVRDSEGIRYLLTPRRGPEGRTGFAPSNLKKHQTSITRGLSSPGRPRPSPECPRIDGRRRHGP